MFKNLRLRNRILLGYLVPVFLSIMVAILVYVNAARVAKQTDLLDTKHEILEELDHLELSHSQIESAASGYLLVKDESYLRVFEEGEKDFKRLVESLKNIGEDSKQRAIIGKIVEKGNYFVSTHRRLVDLVKEGKQSLAVEQVKTGAATQIFMELDGLIGELDKIERDIEGETKKAQGAALRLLIIVVWVGALLSSILAIIIGFWLASDIARSLNETVTAISSTSTEIAATVDQHERTASQQAASVNETTTTIDELGASSRQSAGQADSVAAMAKQALTTTEEGVKMARQASDGMGKMKEKMEGVGEQILHLSEQTGQIGKITTMVTDISGQINMLALNAAVEAVRAGEQGKGFAVIAREIRKLADQGKKSAEQANAIVTDIQKATNSAVMVTEEGTKTAQEVAEIASRTGASFASISGVVSSVYENVQQVSLNSKQQVAAIKQVVEAMSNVNAGAKETAAGISQTKIGIQRLNEAAQGLKKMV